jgi:threonine/homoserine/homoserine lactone efflux protein
MKRYLVGSTILGIGLVAAGYLVLSEVLVTAGALLLVFTIGAWASVRARMAEVDLQNAVATALWHGVRNLFRRGPPNDAPPRPPATQGGSKSAA